MQSRHRYGFVFRMSPPLVAGGAGATGAGGVGDGAGAARAVETTGTAAVTFARESLDAGRRGRASDSFGSVDGSIALGPAADTAGTALAGTGAGGATGALGTAFVTDAARAGW